MGDQHERGPVEGAAFFVVSPEAVGRAAESTTNPSATSKPVTIPAPGACRRQALEALIAILAEQAVNDYLGVTGPEQS